MVPGTERSARILSCRGRFCFSIFRSVYVLSADHVGRGGRLSHSRSCAFWKTRESEIRDDVRPAYPMALHLTSFDKMGGGIKLLVGDGR